MGYNKIGRSDSLSLVCQPDLKDLYDEAASTFRLECILPFLRGQEVPVINYMARLGKVYMSWVLGCLIEGKLSPRLAQTQVRTHTYSENHVIANRLHVGSFVPAKNHLFSWFLIHDGQKRRAFKISPLLVMGLKPRPQISAVYATLCLF